MKKTYRLLKAGMLSIPNNNARVNAKRNEN